MAKNHIEEFMDSEIWKEYEKKENEKRKFIKRGPNVLHLEYLAPLFSDQDITEFEEKLKSVGLELSRYDKNGTMYACMDQYELVVYIALAQPLIGQLIQGVATNASWDVIKYLLLSSWRKLRNRTYYKATSQHSEKKKINFGLKVRLDKNTSFNFELDGDLEETVIQNSLDKILNFLSEQKLNENYKNTDFVYIDKSKDNWIKVDVESEIRKMAKSGKKK